MRGSQTVGVPGEWARVRLVDGSVHRGFLYAADPESGHVVLLRAGADSNRVAPIVLFGGAIESITQAGSASAADAQLKRAVPSSREITAGSGAGDGAANVNERRKAVRSALLAERAPFDEQADGQFVVLGCLRIAPPYTRHSCRCENEVVLDRFLELLGQILVT